MESANAVQMPMETANKLSLEGRVRPQKDGIGGLLDTVVEDVTVAFTELGDAFESMVDSIFGDPSYGWNANGDGKPSPGSSSNQGYVPDSTYLSDVKYAA